MADKPHIREMLRLPAVSGRWTVFWLLVCFAVTATLISLALKKPLWLELEYVVAVWWFIWVFILTKLLYTGEIVRDDHKLKVFEKTEALDSDSISIPRSCSNSRGCSNTGTDAEGCLIILGLLLAVGLI